ncbi:MAG: tRNA (adenosine(37)-N6)-threonylcarbamoyltransferase complex transferase subunit TsaD [Pseudomonadota bacterium]
MTAPDPITVLGIETSCDETAAAVVRLAGQRVEILGETVRSQTEAHAPFGGVVPEIAARAHAELADISVARALELSGLKLSDMDAVAATSGPGLIGGVLVGLMTGKALAQALGKPFVPINHLEGHALSPRLSELCPFPYLLLLVSGGHCQFLDVQALGEYRRLGTTIDDAAGEAFDKTAKVLGLGFPGGPAVERRAEGGDPDAVPLPRPLLNRPGLDMSFAGLKTAVSRAAGDGPILAQRAADICASFQAAVCDILGEKTRRALDVAPRGRLVVAGGVAANQAIRTRLEQVALGAGAAFIAPPLAHCTDNAAMIALAGAERVRASKVPADSLTFSARPRWPLDEDRAAHDPAYGSGRKGAKA